MLCLATLVPDVAAAVRAHSALQHVTPARPLHSKVMQVKEFKLNDPIHLQFLDRRTPMLALQLLRHAVAAYGMYACGAPTTNAMLYTM